MFGTGSDVGKSVVVTALCRAILRRGIRVAPFKAQNMSNNSGVTPEGLEMGRAQIVQAEAARIAPQVDMNPVLLKPTSDLGSQVVVLGRVEGNSLAADYHHRKERLFGTAAAALARLRRTHELVVLEGAGSCAEVNLMAGDFVNLRMAEQAAAPVVLVADIHRGGVFAQIVGTLACLEPRQRDMIRGFIVNRFRGDLTLFADGVRWIEARTGRPVFGVLPWFTDIRIESEDSVAIENPPRVAGAAPGDARLRSSACRTSPTSPTSSRCRRSQACGSTSSSARRTCAGSGRSSCRAPRTPGTISSGCRPPAGPTPSGRTTGTAGTSSGSAAATRCWGHRCTTPTDTRAVPGRPKVWACCRSKRSCRRPRPRP